MRTSLPHPSRRLLLVCGLAVAVLAYQLSFWAGLGHLDQMGSDFSASYVASTVWLQGGNLYDQQLEIARHFALIPPGDHVTVIDLPFITPPLTAVLVAPLTLLDLPTAYRLASLLQYAMLVAAVAVAVRHAPWPSRAPAGLRAAALLGGLAGVGGWVLLLQGQWDGVSALSLALAYAAWRRGHRARAGAWLIGGALLAKPHLALGLAVWMLAWRDRRILAGAVAGAAAVIAASLLLAGPAACLAWVGSLGGSATHSPLPSLLGFTGLFGSWLRDGATAQALAAVCSVLAVGACWLLGGRARRRPDLLEASLAGAVALSLVAAPHLLTHDLSLLAPALAWAVAWAATPVRIRDRRLAAVACGWVMLNLAAYLVLDIGRHPLTAPGRVMPLVLIAVGVIAARACGVSLRTSRPAAAVAPASSASR
ncbi:MAG: hypothetical protein QOG45_257 [Chloroflexota bacterium]|nr:hypothetical protein [Chloroflexota bacterium]